MDPPDIFFSITPKNYHFNNPDLCKIENIQVLPKINVKLDFT